MAPQPVRTENPGREYGLDWLRVIAFSILIVFHTGMYFAPWGWHVKNPEISGWLVWPMSFFHAWRLPLLFFISGAGVYFNLRRRGPAAFVRERLRRLLVPLAFGMFVIVPPQVWVERVVAGRHYGSYLEFWGTVFRMAPYPEGNLSWHHLWFLPYILTYSVFLLPVFIALRSAGGRALVDRLATACEVPGVIWLLNIPSIAAALLLGPHWPVTDNLVSDWANFTGSLITFFWGFVMCGSPRFLGLIESRRREFLAVAAVLLPLFYVVRVFPAPAWTRTVVDAWFGMAMILALAGWGRAKLNRDSPALRWANTAVYPFYIVHQTVTVLLGYAWLGWRVSFAVKFPALLAGTLVVTWLVYEVVRRNAVTRLLFGMKN
jgi:glucans biosynthesis protein C